MDDTIAAVRAVLLTAARGDAMPIEACSLTVGWALAMQNEGGGWSSFVRDCRGW